MAAAAMTYSRAISVLIRHAAQNQSGCGQGFRSMPSDDERREVTRAIEKVRRKAYDFDLDNATRHNLGLI